MAAIEPTLYALSWDGTAICLALPGSGRKTNSLSNALVKLHLGFVQNFDHHRKTLPFDEVSSPTALATHHEEIGISVTFNAALESDGSGLHSSFLSCLGSGREFAVVPISQPGNRSSS